MKKFSNPFLFIFIAGLALSNNLFAQQLLAGNASGTRVAKESANAIDHDVVANESIVNTVTLTAANAKLESRFNSRFPKAVMPQWSTGSEVYFVSFLNNGRKTRACFTTGGRLNYTVTECTLEQLPASLRKNIHASYKDYTLFNAIEMEAGGSIAHQVILENAGGFITLSSTEEGITEIQQVTKGATM